MRPPSEPLGVDPIWGRPAVGSGTGSVAGTPAAFSCEAALFRQIVPTRAGHHEAMPAEAIATARGAHCTPSGMPLSAAAVRAAPEWPAIEAWAEARPKLVSSLYLFGSRMRGDHNEDSDPDIALVGGP